MKKSDTKVYIRFLEPTDALISYHWRNDLEIWKFTGSRPDREISHEIELNWLKKVIVEQGSRRFAICVLPEKRYIGNVQLTNISEKRAEFHIFIGDKRYWGKGIGTEATKLLLDYARNELQLDEVYLYVNHNNHAAVKAYKRNGFIWADKKLGKMIITL